jgi:cell division protein DivIC
MLNNPFKNRAHLKAYVSNHKFLITLCTFILWMTFFDQYDVRNIFGLYQQHQQVLKDKEYYQSQIQDSRVKLKELSSDKDKLEKFARENYLMKRDNEDVFIIEKQHD